MKKILSILKVWLSNLKKNWFSSIINLLLYIIPIIIVKKSISELVEENFLIFVLILIVLFLFSEYIKILFVNCLKNYIKFVAKGQ